MAQFYNQGGYNQGGYGGGPVTILSVNYYTSLLTSEYRLAPNLNAWLPRLLQPLNDVATVSAGMTAAFDLSTAAGVQLDILGQIVGVLRTVPFQPSGGVSPVLTDAAYRILLQATIANNQWDGTQGSLYPIWQTLFPGGQIVIQDQQNMQCIIILSGSFTSIIQDLITNGMIVPRPEGVLYTYTFSATPVFGLDENNSLIAGLDVGHFI